MVQDKTDFIRRLPDSQRHFAKSESIWVKLRIDPILLILLMLLTGFGLMVLYSASEQNISMIKRQVVFFSIAFMAMFCVAQVELSFLKRWAPWFFCVGLMLLILVHFFGVQAKGAQRWLSLGFFRFQPSEVLKLAVPIVISAYFSNKVLPPRLQHVLVALLLIFVPGVLILRQPDLGTAILISSSGLIVLFLAGLRWRFILGSIVALALSAWPVWQFLLHDYQKRRVMTLFNPESDRLGAGWNTIQAKISIGSGGVNGKGWQEGTQSHLNFLPESHTDFIIAVLAEEFGFIGVMFLLVLYLAVVLRGLIIAWSATTSFNRMLAGSLILTFFIYMFVNIGMVAGLLPVVGVPLPLVSLGGTSLVTLMLAFGVLMAVATETKSSSK
jgi:rod shape determining protein RodA